MYMLSMISLSFSDTLAFSTIVLPLLVMSSIFTSRALSSVIDFSPW